MDYLQLQDAGKHTGKAERVAQLSQILGTGWCRANIYKFEEIIKYDMEHQNEFELSYKVLNKEIKLNTATKFIKTIDDIVHVDELNSYLYLVGLFNSKTGEPVDGLRKIGYTDSIKKRLDRFNSDLNKKRTVIYGTISPYEFKAIKVWKGRKDVVIEIERDLHNLLKSYSYIGEWYDTNENFVELLNEILIANGLDEVDVELAKKGSEVRRPYKFSQDV